MCQVHISIDNFQALNDFLGYIPEAYIFHHQYLEIRNE